ncbi:initiator RepB protein (plasmid) [Emticicia oligotrophica DSM 17448]|uniref:Initiator RepB protein n=1 Tax=Emticicia oligotrophica (strain DSM 17448 / CIP 109782 / MTCC 6937 / GPTSA100-15) TaxID=929562 RepID=A0ABN4AUG0_EMTOG|nr:replication initiation protein [Emticicia oligotrophica]AFK05680.1 initiator RepB protein [Emticicia oligotrophica DSM 17448]
MDQSESSKREQALVAISKDPFRVIKGNPLIEAKFELTPIQTKLFLFLLAKLDATKNNFEPMIVVVKDFQKFIGAKGDSLYHHLKKEVEKMIGKRVYYKDDNVELNSSLISGYMYLENEGAFLVEFPSLLKPFLLQLKENFTVIDIRNILGLDSSYAMRFYEICKEKERFKSFEYTVEHIKEMFSIENKYKNYFDFKVKVIVQARNELKENSELYFDFEEIKQGKKVVAIRFKVIKNKKDLQLLDEDLLLKPQNATEILINEIFEAVKTFNVSLRTVQIWFEKYPFLQIKKGVDYTLSEHKKGKIKDVPSYLQKMVAVSQSETPTDKQVKEQNKKLQQKKAESESKVIQEELEKKKSNLLGEYHIQKKQLAIKLLQDNPEVYANLFNTLSQEGSDNKADILTALALQSYQKETPYDSGSLDEFLFNFQQEGTFQSYIFDKMNERFTDFQNLKKDFLSMAKSFGINEEQIF